MKYDQEPMTSTVSPARSGHFNTVQLFQDAENEHILTISNVMCRNYVITKDIYNLAVNIGDHLAHVRPGEDIPFIDELIDKDIYTRGSNK